MTQKQILLTVGYLLIPPLAYYLAKSATKRLIEDLQEAEDQ